MGLARALTASGQPEQAIPMYRDLAAEIDILTCFPDAALDYARALASSGNHQDAGNVLGSLLSSPASPEVDSRHFFDALIPLRSTSSW
jgi:hypothetical protein